MIDLVKNHLKELQVVFAKHKVLRAEIFGSAATSNFTNESDIDILVTFNDDIELLDYADNYFELKEKLENIFQRNVDLVSSRSLKNPILIESINKSKVSLYAA